jgi:hypothetical protein
LPAASSACSSEKVRPALVDDDNLAVYDGLTGHIEGASDHREALRPVEPVAGVDLLISVFDVNLDPIAIELDFMEPLVAHRRLQFQGCQLGFYEPRQFRTASVRVATDTH